MLRPVCRVDHIALNYNALIYWCIWMFFLSISMVLAVVSTRQTFIDCGVLYRCQRFTHRTRIASSSFLYYFYSFFSSLFLPLLSAYSCQKENHIMCVYLLMVCNKCRGRKKASLSLSIVQSFVNGCDSMKRTNERRTECEKWITQHLMLCYVFSSTNARGIVTRKIKTHNNQPLAHSSTHACVTVCVIILMPAIYSINNITAQKNNTFPDSYILLHILYRLHDVGMEWKKTPNEKARTHTFISIAFFDVYCYCV